MAALHCRYLGLVQEIFTFQPPYADRLPHRPTVEMSADPFWRGRCSAGANPSPEENGRNCYWLHESSRRSAAGLGYSHPQCRPCKPMHYILVRVQHRNMSGISLHIHAPSFAEHHEGISVQAYLCTGLACCFHSWLFSLILFLLHRQQCQLRCRLRRTFKSELGQCSPVHLRGSQVQQNR
jgi:hypothetical protein